MGQKGKNKQNRNLKTSIPACDTSQLLGKGKIEKGKNVSRSAGKRSSLPAIFTHLREQTASTSLSVARTQKGTKK